MPFIGQQPLTGAYHKLDSITTSATATYNLQLNGGAYSPTSANHLLVSLNGVMQAPQDSFTVSGSQITFASALTSSDSIDFIMALGDVLDIGVPSDGTVNTSQLANTLDLSGKTVTYGLTSSDMPAGSVIQTVVYQVGSGFSNSIAVNITSGGQDLGGGTITPTSASNKILVFASNIMHNDTAGPYGYLRLMREINSSVTTLTTWGNATGYTFSGGSRHQFAVAYYDTPATTQEITYRHRLDHLSGSIDNTWNYGAASLVLMEIAQ
jgi:hypothetical protein